MKDENSKKNVEIEYLRFFNSLLIIFCHIYMLDGAIGSWHFGGGYIAVEYFLLLTGFFTAKYCDKVMEEEKNVKNFPKIATKYMFNKISRILPFTTIAYLVIYGYYLVVHIDDVSIVKSILIEAVWDFLLFQEAGLKFYNYIQPLWYVSALIIVLPVFIYICLRFNDLFKWILCWICPILIYGFFCQTERTIAGSNGILRTIAGMCCGGLCYYLCGYLKKYNKKSFVFKVIFLGTVIALLLLADWVNHCSEDFVAVLLYMLQIMTLNLNFSSNKCRIYTEIGIFLGKMSMPMYVYHPVVMVIVRDVTNCCILLKFAISIIVTLLFSVLTYLLVQILDKVYKNKLNGNINSFIS